MLTEMENVNVSYIFDLKSRVIAKCGNRSEETAGRCQNNRLSNTSGEMAIVLGTFLKVSRSVISLITSAEREVKDSRRSGMYQS